MWAQSVWSGSEEQINYSDFSINEKKVYKIPSALKAQINFSVLFPFQGIQADGIKRTESLNIKLVGYT
jgi:hypothetical protein